MKRIALLLALAAPAATAILNAQTTPAKPATAKPAVSTAAHKTGTATAATGVKLPPGVPPARGLMKTAFALRYQDTKVGTGKDAEPGKLYKVQYTGWLASDGKKFDSSFDHRKPILDKDGKPENDADGKPKLGEAEPIQFPQGRRGVIPGWDQGFTGMKVGGKRRLFIPYQLAYGDAGRPPVIPAKSDLIFDIELVDVSDMPAQPTRPGMPGGPGGMGAPRPMAPHPGAAPAGAPGTPAPPTGAPATQPTTAPASPASKPADPTAPTVAPNSAPAPSTPAPTAPSTPPPTAAPDKPANPAQPPA